jgi:hypothetical protein
VPEIKKEIVFDILLTLFCDKMSKSKGEYNATTLTKNPNPNNTIV